MVICGAKKVKLFMGVSFLSAALLLFFSVAAHAAQKGKIVVLGAVSGFVMRGGDPHTHGGSVGTTIVSLMYDGVAHKQNDSKIVPAIAKSWTIDSNWANIKFVLDERAKFTDGTPVSADDVKFSIDRAMRKEMRFVFGSELRRMVDRVEVVDKQTVIVHLKQPYPAFLDRSSKVLLVVPKAYVRKMGNEEFAKKPMGAGPFKFKSMQQDVYFDVVAKKEHYRKVPHVKEVSYRCVPEIQTRMAMLQTGEGDIAMLVTQMVGTVEKDPDLRIVRSKYGNMQTLLFYDMAFPDESSVWHDIRVRTAAAYAINTRVIAKKVLQGLVEPWGNLVAPYHPGFDPSLKPHPYDPEKAKELLAEAGYPNGFDTELGGSIAWKLQGQAVQANLSKVGIRAKLNMPEHGMWRKMLQGRKWRHIGINATPYWNGRMHPATALQSTLDPKSPHTYTPDKELGDAWAKMMGMVDEEELAAQVSLLTQLYLKKKLRINLWANHALYGLTKRIKYWENPPGRIFPVNLEYATLSE